MNFEELEKLLDDDLESVLEHVLDGIDIEIESKFVEKRHFDCYNFMILCGLLPISLGTVPFIDTYKKRKRIMNEVYYYFDEVVGDKFLAHTVKQMKKSVSKKEFKENVAKMPAL